MAVAIRQGVAEDAGQIAALYNAVVRDTALTFTSLERPAEAVAQAIAGGQSHWVAAGEGRFLGYATFAPFRAGPGYAHTFEHSIYVVPEAGRRGVGTALLHALEAGARDAGCHALIAGIAGSNSAARAFHAAAGFDEVGQLREVGRKFGQWHDLVLMQKILSDRADRG